MSLACLIVYNCSDTAIAVMNAQPEIAKLFTSPQTNIDWCCILSWVFLQVCLQKVDHAEI